MNMSNTFDIYARISNEGERTPDEVAAQLALYETACRDWAERSEVEVGLVVTETNVSGAVKIEERELGRLLSRIEAGESGGILTPYLDRFGRDQIEGCLALRRITLAGGRLVCVNDGIDSAQPGSKLIFQMRMAIAEDFLERTRANFQARIEAAAAKGVYLACKPPVGYVLDHGTGRINPHTEMAELIREVFERRANGETMGSLAKWLREAGGSIEVPNPKRMKNRKPGDPETVFPLAAITGKGVAHLIRSRAYLGESTVQSGTRGQPRVVENAHKPLVTPNLWERAQAAGGPNPRNNGRWSEQVRLAGLVQCPNGHRLRTGGRNGNGKQVAAYVCNDPNCDKRASIDAKLLDEHVASMLTEAAYKADRHVAAIMDGDDRYARALQAVEDARKEVETYRAEIKVTDVGAAAWKVDVTMRQAALDLAREELKGVPAPKTLVGLTKGRAITFEEALPGIEREHFGRFVDRVVVFPVGYGRRVPIAERTEVYWVGSDTPAEYEPSEDLTELVAKLAETEAA